MAKMRGKFITIEGSEGVGKSTNIAFIQEYLMQKGIELIVTREPGGTPLAEDIRRLLVEEREEPMNEIAELLLIFAARAQHLQQRILPALDAGHWVLCDRFIDSTYAYQGSGRGMDKTLIQQFETIVHSGCQPDVTFYLDIDVKLGLERTQKRAKRDRFEHEAIGFFEQVRAGYLDRVKQNPGRYRMIDAGQSLERVQADILRELTKL